MQLTQKKSQRGDLLTAAAVAMLLAVMAALLYTGSLTRQVTNMLIPTAVYIVMAVSLNLVVGLLGELTLGSRRASCPWACSPAVWSPSQLTHTALPLIGAPAGEHAGRRPGGSGVRPAGGAAHAAAARAIIWPS